jgi:hypothetical protein
MQDAPLFHMGPMTAVAVARIGYRAMHRGKPLAVAGVGSKMLAFSVRLVPRALARNVVKRIQ